MLRNVGAGRERNAGAGRERNAGAGRERNGYLLLWVVPRAWAPGS